MAQDYLDDLINPELGKKQSATSGRTEQAQFGARVSEPTIEQESGEYTQGVGGSFLAGVPINKQDAISFLSKRTGLPKTRFVITSKGDIAYKGDDDKYYPAVSSTGYYAPDVMQGLLEVGAGAYGSRFGPFTSPVVGGGTSGAIEYGRQKWGQELSGSDTIDPFRVGVATFLGGAGEALPTAYKMYKGSRIADDIADLNKADLENILNLSEKYDVPLTTAEATDLSSLKAKQFVASKSTQTSRKLDAFYKQRARKVEDAVNNYLDNISLQKETYLGGKTGIETIAARKAQLKQSRKQATEPLYQEALQDAKPVDTTNIIYKIDGFLETAKGDSVGVFNKVKNDFYRSTEIPVIDKATGKPVLDKFGQPKMTVVRDLDTRPEALHELKESLDAMYRGEDVKGLDAKVQAKLQEIKDDLNNAIRKDNKLYKEADATYSELSKPIDELDDSKVGDIVKRLKDFDRDKFIDKLFKDSDPMSIRYAKEQMEKVNPEAWNEVTRGWLQKNWEQASKQFRAQKDAPIDAGLSWKNLLLGDQKSQRTLKAALSPEQYDTLVELSTVLEVAGSVKKVDSGTAFNTQMIEEFKKSGWDIVDIDFTKPAGTVIKALREKKFRDNIDQFTDIILDPTKINELKELQKIPPGRPEFIGGLVNVLTQTGAKEITKPSLGSEMYSLQETQEKELDKEQGANYLNDLLGL